MANKSNILLLDNRVAYFQRLTDYEAVSETLKYRKPGWEYTPAGALYVRWAAGVKKGVEDCDPDNPVGWDGYVHIMNGSSCGAGLAIAMRDKIEEALGTPLTIRDQRTTPRYHAWRSDDKDRDYQIACVKAMVQCKTGGLILNATGTGKTYIAGKYFSLLQGPGLFIVDELSLLYQAIAELREVCREDIGEIGNGTFNPQRISVGTVQTLFRHQDNPRFHTWMQSLEAVIVDEVHTALNRSNFGVVQAISPPVVFGLTATLELKKKHVALRAYNLAGPVLFEYPLEQGVRENVLSKGLAISCQLRQDYKSEPVRGYTFWQRQMKHMKNYREEYVKLIVDSKLRNQHILELIQAAHKRGKYILVLVERIQHIKNLESLLQKQDMDFHSVYGAKRAEERIASKARFESGFTRILVGNKVFKKGVNIKRVDVIIDAAAMKNRNDAVQKYGRGVRLAAEKDGLIYIDIADYGNRFEKSAKIRRAALKKIGVPIFKAPASLGASRILDVAEERLKLL